MKRTRYMIIISAILAVLVLAVGIVAANRKWIAAYYYNDFIGGNPRRAIQNSIGLKLPTLAEIVNYNYTEETKYYEATVKISEQDIPELQKALLNFFDTDYIEEEGLKSGENADGRKVISGYAGTLVLDKPLTKWGDHIPVCASIYYENDQNYLYIYAVIDASKYEYIDSYQGIKL